MMKVDITFKQMDSSASVKEYIQEKVEKLSRFSLQAAEIHVKLHHERNHHQAQIDVSAKDVHARGEASSGDVYKAFDEAFDKIEKTLRRHHDKVVRIRSDARA
ncbi:MAG: ribosome-associated translation inhibitor RaiA [Bdellovibrionales bacterium]|nr:ribosome-associated translation inhibitor RaiA [Bdellovibrionales bacterium]